MSKHPLVGVCHGSRCADYGGKELAAALCLQGVGFEILACQSLCPHAPVVRIDGVAKLKANLDNISIDLKILYRDR